MLHGESLREYYAWTGRYSAELMAAGALLHIPESLEALGRTALDLRRLASEVIAFQREIPQAEIALLYSPTSMYTVPDYPAKLRKSYTALSHQDLPVRFLSERQLVSGRTDRVKLLILAGANRLESATAKAFAARGGTILTEPDSRFTDPYGEPLAGFPVKRCKLSAPELDREIADLQLQRPVRSNSATRSVELRSVRRDRTLLFYAINYGSSADFQPLLNGKMLKEATELISGKPVRFPIRLPQRKTMLFEVKL